METRLSCVYFGLSFKVSYIFQEIVHCFSLIMFVQQIGLDLSFPSEIVSSVQRKTPDKN